MLLPDRTARWACAVAAPPEAELPWRLLVPADPADMLLPDLAARSVYAAAAAAPAAVAPAASATATGLSQLVLLSAWFS